ncbi:hypothetical protein [Xanthocytophaga flava]|uniref:hypothetical protein n=1 Tax=Xanthocytophaga flava TaxID=3048013 RepID=UPI0028D065D7|nr:hypothetical protein [Xanthocytophaga flavus]MDJ1466826.1 hypothetical protein [Xanthocytophaga flavus]
MIRHIFFVIFSLLLTHHLFGQVQHELMAVLKKKNLTILRQYTDRINHNTKNRKAGWEYIRDVTPGYQEGVYHMEEWVSNKNDLNTQTIYTFRVAFILAKETICFYNLSVEKNRKVENNWVPYFETIDSFKDDSLYQHFKNEFKALFQTALDENDLFTHDLTYGKHCYRSGIPPEGRKKIEVFVQNKDKDSLLQWLHSPNTEKQVYAIDGLYQLKKQGISLTQKELQQIQFVTHKKGRVYTCQGCFLGSENISEITKEFKF